MMGGRLGSSRAEGRSPIRPTNSTITISNRLDHLFARWGVRRSAHRVEPGLYSLGSPGPDSPVFVTANYTLSFDALRSALRGMDGHILVLDTRGINVWCAAGKGTFGTDELVRRIEETGLADVVSHRRLVLPQLGATGVSAHEVARRTGFSVTYGPVRADDIPEFMSKGEATREMRTVRFGLPDRVVLIPVELVYFVVPSVVTAVILYFVGGPVVAWAFVAAVLSGLVLFPVLLPWLPTPNFSTRGFLLGLVTALPFTLWLALSAGSGDPTPAWARVGRAVACILTMPVVTAFIALNFTGSTTFTSRTGVKREIMTYFPSMVWTAGSGLALLLVTAAGRLIAGA